MTDPSSSIDAGRLGVGESPVVEATSQRGAALEGRANRSVQHA